MVVLQAYYHTGKAVVFKTGWLTPAPTRWAGSKNWWRLRGRGLLAIVGPGIAMKRGAELTQRHPSLLLVLILLDGLVVLVVAEG